MPYVTDNLKTEAFIAGYQDLFTELKTNPQLRLVPITKLTNISIGLTNLGYQFRIRYRGPHLATRDTLKKDAKAFTVYLQDD